MARRKRPKLHFCPLCGSEAVSRWRADDLGDRFRARVNLQCAACDTPRELVATIWAVDAYSRRYESQRFEIAVALKEAERERMTADAELLAEALRNDLLVPDDFTMRSARVR